jgi:predicted nucleic acid-binding protein
VVGTAGGFPLDTNVISELMKARPSHRVEEWIDSTPEELMHLSVITIGEIRKGIDLLDDDDPKRAALQSWLNRDLRVRFAGRLLPLDEGVAERWGQLEALAKRMRFTMSQGKQRRSSPATAPWHRRQDQCVGVIAGEKSRST